MKKNCRHCGLKPICRPRQLCWKCFYTLSVRALYRAKVNDKTDRDRYEVNDDPTEEELEQMIAEQLPTMPDCHTAKFGHWTLPVIKVGVRGCRRLNGYTWNGL